MVAKYRADHGLAAAKLSPQLSIVANRHLLDLRQNIRSLTHSWSNCAYDINDKKSWPCVMNAPARLGTSYKGEGYETLYRTSTGSASGQLAFEAWKKSTLHNSIIINLDAFKAVKWDEVGVAIDGEFAALWFGSPEFNVTRSASNAEGLGVTYDQAVRGLPKSISIGRESSTVEGGKWSGTSADKKVKLEIYGVPSEVAEVTVRISVKLEADGKLSPANNKTLVALLTNLLPNFTEREEWLQRTLKTLGAEKDAMRTLLVRGIAVELTKSANSISLYVRPAKKVVAKEVF